VSLWLTGGRFLNFFEATPRTGGAAAINFKRGRKGFGLSAHLAAEPLVLRKVR